VRPTADMCNHAMVWTCALAMIATTSRAQPATETPAAPPASSPGSPSRTEATAPAAEREGAEKRIEDTAPTSTTPIPAAGATSASSAAELSKKLSNPIANLISIPFQFNYDEGFGPNDAGRWLLNFQPVIPISLGERWNLILRTIVPVISLESPAPTIDGETGIGDILQSFFFSPKEGKIIWGIGPAINYPTATDHTLGAQQWGLGPTGVVLRQRHGWTYGILANHIWGFPDDDESEINQTFLQPFLSYTFHTATSITLNSESTYEWNASEWTVPLNLTVGQVVHLGKLPVQFFVGGRWYAESPDDGPEWGVRFGFTLLLPK